MVVYHSTIQLFHMTLDHVVSIPHSWIDWATAVSGSTPVGQVDPVVGQSGLTLAVVGVIGLLAVVGVGIIVVRHRGQETVPHSTPTEPPGTASDATTEPAETQPVDSSDSSGTAGTGGGATQLSDRTLDRLESVVPAAVSRARNQHVIDWSTSELRSELEEAITAGRLDPAVSSSFGVPYELVNLSSQYRELTLPVSGETVHIADIGTVARETVANDPPQDVARTIAALDDHCERIESHIEQQESAFLGAHNPVEATLDDIRELTDRFDGAFGNRLTEFVVESRHDDLFGVVDIERRLVDARQSLHQAAFDDAMRTVETTAQMADDLLVTAEFVGGVVGTIDHGGGTVPIPESVPTMVFADLVPLAEQQYDCSIELVDQELVITATQPATGRDSAPSESFDPVDDSGATNDSGRSTRDHVRPEAVADEVLFLFRELDTNTTLGVVEYQTEQLPAAIGRPEVLNVVVSFCTRQSDIVETVELQDDAPPGFLEIEFTDRVGATTGLETLHERYVTQHGNSS